MAEVTPSGSGGPIELTGPAVDGGLEIRGGIGGITFQLEELMGGAEKLDALAEELAAVEVEVQPHLGRPGRLTRMSRAPRERSAAVVGEAQWSVQAVRTELQDISSQVRASKQDYEAAEAWAGFGREHGVDRRRNLGQQAGI